MLSGLKNKNIQVRLSISSKRIMDTPPLLSGIPKEHPKQAVYQLDFEPNLKFIKY